MNAACQTKCVTRVLCGSAICAVAAAALLLLCSAGCGSAANPADGQPAIAAEAASAADTPSKSVPGKVVRRVAAGEPASTASALLLVKFREPSIAFPRLEPAAEQEFKIYKRTQAELLKSRFVLAQAIRSPEVKELKVDGRYRLVDDLSVEFPGDAEIMKVSLGSADPHEAKVVLQAVVDAYLTQVVNIDRNRLRSRLEQLDRVCAETSDRLRARQVELKEANERLGQRDLDHVSPALQADLEQYVESQKDLSRLQADLRRAKAELDMRKAAFKGLDDADISELEIDALAQSDLQTSQVLVPLLVQVKRLLAESDLTSKTAPDAQSVAKLQRHAQDIEKQLAVRREELRDKLRHGKAVAMKAEIRTLEQQIGVGTDMVARAEREVQERRKAAERLSFPIDFTMMRGDIERLEGLFRELSQERERLAIEVNAPPRVTLIQRAEVPTGRF